MRRPRRVCSFERVVETGLLLLFLPVCLAASELCRSAAGRPDTFSEAAPALPPGEERCYTADLPSPGVWLVAVSAGAGEEGEPALRVFRQPCSTDGEPAAPAVRVLQRTLGGALLRVLVPGRFLFCVAAWDPRLPLGEHRVTSLFAMTPTEPDPDEDEPDPAPLSPPPAGEPAATEPALTSDGEQVTLELHRLAHACAGIREDDLAYLWARLLARP